MSSSVNWLMITSSPSNLLGKAEEEEKRTEGDSEKRGGRQWRKGEKKESGRRARRGDLVRDGSGPGVIWLVPFTLRYLTKPIKWAELQIWFMLELYFVGKQYQIGQLVEFSWCVYKCVCVCDTMTFYGGVAGVAVIASVPHSSSLSR